MRGHKASYLALVAAVSPALITENLVKEWLCLRGEPGSMRESCRDITSMRDKSFKKLAQEEDMQLPWFIRIKDHGSFLERQGRG